MIRLVMALLIVGWATPLLAQQELIGQHEQQEFGQRGDVDDKTPEDDSGSFWLTVYAAKEDQERIKQIFAGDQGLIDLATQCRTRTIDVDSQVYQQKYQSYHPDTPSVVLQDPDGAVVYKVSGQLPSSGVMAGEMKQSIAGYATQSAGDKIDVGRPRKIPLIKIPQIRPSGGFDFFSLFRSKPVSTQIASVAVVIVLCLIAFHLGSKNDKGA